MIMSRGETVSAGGRGLRAGGEHGCKAMHALRDDVLRWARTIWCDGAMWWKQKEVVRYGGNDEMVCERLASTARAGAPRGAESVINVPLWSTEARGSVGPLLGRCVLRRAGTYSNAMRDTW